MSNTAIDYPSDLAKLEILQVYDEDASVAARRAVRFAAKIANRRGAALFVQGSADVPDYAIYDFQETTVSDNPADWVTQADMRIVLRACVDGTSQSASADDATVFVELASWHSETTLFAASGLADLNGHPDEAPLVPAANYAAHTIGYGAFGALCAVCCRLARFGRRESAVVNGLALLGWVNWKAGAAGKMGQELTRRGTMAEWPILECADGHTSCLYTERDWQSMVKMIGDPALNAPEFGSHKLREENRDGYMPIIRNWAAQRSKEEIRKSFEEYAIPGAPVLTINDILDDALFAHRGTFEPVGDSVTPLPAERLVAHSPKADASPGEKPETGDKPLSGITVLDLGIITAGAGVGAVLADLGATVLKIESATYPDPFRQWAGSDDSPLFRFNNRNKKGLAIDLKTDEGKADFLNLVGTADIVLENFRRGVMERLGLDFDTLRNANPAILSVSVSGQGISGPGTSASTFGSTLEASSGYSTLTRDIRGLPYISGRELNYPDQIICVYGAAVITAAVAEVQRTGRGRHIDISQRDCALYQIGDVIECVSCGNSEAPEQVRAAISDRDIDQIVTCADGVHVAFTMPPGADQSKIAGLDAGLQSWAEGYDSEAAISLFLEAGFGAAAAVKGSQMVQDPIIRSGQAFAKGISTGMVKGFPFQLVGAPLAIYADAPVVGQHNSEFSLEEPSQ